MPALSSGSWQRRPVSPEAGSPAKQSGGGGRPRNWRCGCTPGLLGPPTSPIPPLLRSTVELSAAGPPTTWKLANQQHLTTLALQWKPNLGQPSNPLLLFPPSLLTATSLLPTEPSSWSLELVDNVLHCSITWSTSADAATTAADPASPVPSCFDDSGYASPAHSPIPFVLPSEDETGPLTSPVPNKTTMDATTETTPRPVHSSSSQTTPPSTCVNVGVQPSPSIQIETLDAATNTTSTIVTSCCSQTPSTTTTDSCLQTSLPEPPSTAPTTTSTTKKNKKRRKPKATDSTTSPTPTVDAGTSYDPPPTVIPRWCRLCSSPILPDTKPLSHLFTCDGLPHLLGAECEGLLNDWSETLGLSLDALATMSELLLTTFDPCPTDPSTSAFTSKDFLIGKLIPRSCTASYEKYPQFWSHLVHLTTSLENECRNLLKLPSTESLSVLFSNIDPEIDENTDVDDGDLAEFDPHHPFDELDNIPTDYESECYLGDEY